MKIIKYHENIYIHSHIIENVKTGHNLKTLTLIWFLFSSTEGRQMNTKIGLHTFPPPPTTQTFRPLPEGLGR